MVGDSSGVSKHSNAADGEDTKTDKHGAKTISDAPMVSDGEGQETPSTQDTEGMVPGHMFQCVAPQENC